MSMYDAGKGCGMMKVRDVDSRALRIDLVGRHLFSDEVHRSK